MNDSSRAPSQDRQLSALAASGSLVLYLSIAVGLVLVAGVLVFVRFLG